MPNRAYRRVPVVDFATSRDRGIQVVYQLRDWRRTAMNERTDAGGADAGGTIAKMASSRPYSITHGHMTADTYIVPSFNRNRLTRL